MHANDLFDTITRQLIADIETGAAGDWRMPWHTLAYTGTPTSIDGRPYRGANALWLAMTATGRHYPTGVWGTYRAWQRHGAQVRRGEHAIHVILWKPTTPTTQPDDNDAERGRRRLLARAYAVFAAEQCDGADDIIARRAEHLARRDTPDRIDAAERYLAAVPATVIEGGNRACYAPVADTIHLPALAQFDIAAHYYATRAHETVHWTGHPDRLDRDLSGRFGTDAYAAEELVAELGAAMWCAQAGLSAVTRLDHAAYLAGWLRVLHSDARALVTVASSAQAAIDWLNTLTGHTTGDGKPAEEAARTGRPTGASDHSAATPAETFAVLVEVMLERYVSRGDETSFDTAEFPQTGARRRPRPVRHVRHLPSTAPAATPTVPVAVGGRFRVP